MLTPEEIAARVDAIVAGAKARYGEPSNISSVFLDPLTPEERAEVHALKMQLPTFAEERSAAHDRIQERIAARKRKAI